MKRIIDFFMNKNSLRKVETELYPDPISSRGEQDLPARARGEIKNDLSLCTGCGDCVTHCPTSCIELVNGPEIDDRPNVEVFNIDFSNCIFCGECVAVCEPESLTQKKKFLLPVEKPSDLKIRFGRRDDADD
jgi:formate hydrogenlyase subunit 6/NADH:ubiquinone oxidoreductase subunit I